MDNLMRRAIDSELNHWGGWLERHRDYQGYPRCDNVQAFLNGAGGGTPGHRVLCDDMPTAIYAVHGRVLRLPQAEQEAVWVFFAFRLKPDGETFWTLEEKCRESGIQEASLRRRIARARYRIAGLPVPRWEKKENAIAA
jgi:hypothetical protein